MFIACTWWLMVWRIDIVLALYILLYAMVVVLLLLNLPIITGGFSSVYLWVGPKCLHAKMRKCKCLAS